jgi:rare lipoprotein A
VIDLSKSAARKLDMIEDGTAPVRVEAKPSDQPSDAAKEKVETKVEQAVKTGDHTTGTSRQTGDSGSDTVSQSGSGK